MSKRILIIRDQRAFTLLEIIVTIVVAAVVGTMIFQLMGTSMWRSADAVVDVQDQAYLEQVMENITADYNYLVATSLNPLGDLSTNVGAEGSNQNNSYGVYHVVKNRRVSFDGNNQEMADVSGNIQRITISHQNFTLTGLFSK